MRRFLAAALASALDHGQASADDVLAHVTPAVLAAHLPRPLWARLITGALGAPALSARAIVDIIGLGNLCEHMPPPILWACLAEIAARQVGVAAAPPPRQARPSAAPPPPDPDVDSALDSLEVRTPTAATATDEPARRYRPHSVTNAGQTSRALAGNTRRPQRRSQAPETQADTGSDDRGPATRDVEVDDEQLVEWSANEETSTSDDPAGRRGAS